MACVHNERRKTSRDPIRFDPTKTSLIRRQFVAETSRRIRALRRAVWDFVWTQDALGLKAGAPGSVLFGNQISQSDRSDEKPVLLASPQFRQFQFRTDSNKVKAFRDWLQEQINSDILSPVGAKDPSKPWTAPYIESAYKKGMVNAYAKTKAKIAVNDKEFFDKSLEEFIKTAFGKPETTRKLELLSTRTFEDLKGITDEMARKLNRILADGMVNGLGAYEIAKNMTAEIDSISDRRAIVLARTEVIHAHAEGQLDAMTDLGVSEVGVEVEWSTAGDDRVCPQCEAMEGQTFPIDEAHGLIPLHPQCRCAWIPAIPKSLLK